MADGLVRLNSANTRLKQSNLDLDRNLRSATKLVKKLVKKNKNLASENAKLKKRLKEFERINKSK